MRRLATPGPTRRREAELHDAELLAGDVPWLGVQDLLVQIRATAVRSAPIARSGQVRQPCFVGVHE